MNILLIGKDGDIEKILNHFLSFEKDWRYTSIYDDGNTINNVDNIDLIIVNSLNQLHNNTFNNILETHRNKRTILISSQLKTSVEEGCEYCVNNYQRKRLVKPVAAKELYNLIKNFDTLSCSLHNRFNSIKTTLPFIIKRFSYLTYDKNSSIIYGDKKSPTNQYTYQFIGLISILKQNKIPYSILNEHEIELQIN